VDFLFFEIFHFGFHVIVFVQKSGYRGYMGEAIIKSIFSISKEYASIYVV